MPPAKVGCTACRISKTKCDGAPSRSPCSRCTRIGLQCTFVPSRRGKGHINRTISKLGPAVKELLKPQTSPPEGLLRVVVKKLLSEWASLARSRNSHRLMKCALQLAERSGVSVAEVILASSASSVSSGLQRTLRCPPEIMSLISGSSGYCWARRVAGADQNLYFTNSAFDNAVANTEQMVAMERATSDSEQLLGLFLHSDDICLLCDLFDKLVDQLTSTDSPRQLTGRYVFEDFRDTVRVFDRRLGYHVPCAGRLMLLAEPLGVRRHRKSYL